MKIYPLCHRIPERTFKIKGHYFPVCSRCTGIYTGAMAYYLLINFLQIEYNIFIILISIMMVIPTFIDGLTQLFGYRESNNKKRFITGLIAGWGLVILTRAFKLFFMGEWNVFTLMQ